MSLSHKTKKSEPVSACVYFNWFLDYEHAADGQIADVGRILEQMEGCDQWRQ